LQLDEIDKIYENAKSERSPSNRRQFNIIQNRVSQIDDFIYMSPVTDELIEESLNVAKYDCNVIIEGETGVGKEKIMEILHKNSSRNGNPCIKVNCATIQENLAESEFFGYEGGSFTGANREGKKGYFEIANGGVLFLDEIGQLSLTMQSKLLRVLQENAFFRVGGTKQVNVNVRVICANNVSLQTLIDQGKFREDLYYRLNISIIVVPPLRKRPEDIICLSEEFLKKYCNKYDVEKSLEDEAMNALSTYAWPGNVRELENMIHRLVINSKEDVIKSLEVESIIHGRVYENVMMKLRSEISSGNSLDFEEIMKQQEKKLLEYALKKEVTTRKAADFLGITQAKFMRKKQKYDIS
jgi:transcriptional regulator with PAS, ATPase and Fis domain